MPPNYFVDFMSEDILRCILSFLHVNEIFSVVATSSKLWALADPAAMTTFSDCESSQSSNNSQQLTTDNFVQKLSDSNRFAVFNSTWSSAGVLALRRYERLIGPFRNVVLTEGLTSSVSNPEDLHFILNHIATRPLNSITIRFGANPCPLKELQEHSQDFCLIPKGALKSRHLLLVITKLIPARINCICRFFNVIDTCHVEGLHLILHLSLLLGAQQILTNDDDAWNDICFTNLRQLCICVSVQLRQLQQLFDCTGKRNTLKDKARDSKLNL